MEKTGSKQNTGAPGLPRITDKLLSWYHRCRRILPWREDPTPYHVWISEIMLQQTRVEAAIPYYERFLAELPDVAALASAAEDRLLKLWEGLGYYSRVRNLQKAARQVMERHGGSLPSDPKQLEALAGIGPYTAAAIASIAYQVRVPSVDGNLLRVYARLTGYAENILTPAAKKAAAAAFFEILPEDRPGDMNQALMDLGATVCLPNGAPLCGSCPVAAFCTALREDLQEELPLVEKKAPRRIEDHTVLMIRAELPADEADAPRRAENTVVSPAEAPHSDCVLLQKRPAKGLLAGLWEFPNEPLCLTEDDVRSWCSAQGLDVAALRPLPSARHIFTHLEWNMTGYEIRVTVRDPAALTGVFVPVPQILEDYALPSAFSAYTALL